MHCRVILHSHKVLQPLKYNQTREVFFKVWLFLIRISRVLVFLCFFCGGLFVKTRTEQYNTELNSTQMSIL